MSLTKNKLYNSIIASKIEIDYNNIQTSIKQINKQLSLPKLETIQTINTNNKYNNYLSYGNTIH